MTATGKSASIKWLITLALPALICVFPANEIFTAAMKAFSAITLLAMLLMAFELTPIFVPAIILPVGYTIFSVTPKEVVYNAWTGQVPWVLIGSMIVARIMEKTGLSKRIAYGSMMLARGNFLLLMFGFLLAGVILSAFVPAAMARTALFCAIMISLCQAMSYKADSPYALIGFATVYIVANDAGMCWMTGSNANIVLVGLMNSAGVPVNWTEFAMDSLVPSIVWMIIEILALFVLYVRRGTFAGHDCNETKKYILEQYQNLGPVSPKEKKSIIFVLVIVALLLFGKYHGLNPGQVFIIMSCIAFLPGVELAKNEDLNAVNFSMVLLVVACVSIGDVASSLGIGKIMVNKLIPYMPDNIFGLVSFISGLTFVGNMLMTPLALVSGLTVPIIELCNSIGIPAVGICLMFWLSCMSILLPYETTTALLVYSYNMMSLGEFIKIFAIKALITFICTFAVFLPWFHIIGVL